MTGRWQRCGSAGAAPWAEGNAPCGACLRREYFGKDEERARLSAQGAGQPVLALDHGGKIDRCNLPIPHDLTPIDKKVFEPTELLNMLETVKKERYRQPEEK